MKKIIKEYGLFVLALVAIILVKMFVFSPVRVSGPSMEPTLHRGDIMILNKMSYRSNDIERFDIVVVRHRGELLIKRVIGLPGEHIEYQGDRLLIDEVETEEPFETTYIEDFDLTRGLGIEVIPTNYYFVLGDNRLDSLDSRAIGVVSKDQILGRANFIILPFNRFGRVE